MSKGNDHRLRLIKLLLKDPRCPKKDLLTIGNVTNNTKDPEIKHLKSVNLTEISQVLAKNSPRICLVNMTKGTGYTATYMTTLIMGVYPSNQTKRDQMKGRINRIGWQRRHRRYFVFYTEACVSLEYQRQAKNLQQMLSQLTTGVSGGTSDGTYIYIYDSYILYVYMINVYTHI